MSRSHLAAEPNLAPLERELAACRIPAGQISHTAARLSRPPQLIALSACDDPTPDAAVAMGMVEREKDRIEQLVKRGMSVRNIADELAKTDVRRILQSLRRRYEKLGRFAPPRRVFNGDAAAVLLYVEKGHLDTRPTWKSLSRAERKRAKLLWNWFGSNHGLNVTPKGAPARIDVALVLYLMRVLCEATGRKDFPRLNAPHSFAAGKLTSPMWRALNEALPLAQAFLQRRYPGYGAPAIGRRVNTAKAHDVYTIGRHIESAAELIRVVRSKPFEKLCRTLRLGKSAADIAASPVTFRVAIAYARKSSSQFAGS